MNQKPEKTIKKIQEINDIKKNLEILKKQFFIFFPLILVTLFGLEAFDPNGGDFFNALDVVILTSVFSIFLYLKRFSETVIKSMEDFDKKD